MKQKTLIASSESRVPALATAITKEVKKEGSAYIQALGAQAINQMIKAVAAAGAYMDDEGKTITCKIRFERTEYGCNAIQIHATTTKE